MPFDLDYARSRLAGRRIDWFSSIDSTMTVASRLAREGCAHGTIAGADHQTAGVGRHRHRWHSEAETGLYVSLVLRLPIEPLLLPVVMLALGLAVHDAIVHVTGLPVDLRWPNDVLSDGKKCAGILAHLEGDAVIAGIGINTSQSTFPEELAGLATSLRLSGVAVEKCSNLREDLLIALSGAVDESVEILCQRGSSAILQGFAASSSYVEGRRVSVEQNGSLIVGVTRGLDTTGFLRVLQDDGTEVTILAGGVRPE